MIWTGGGLDGGGGCDAGAVGQPGGMGGEGMCGEVAYVKWVDGGVNAGAVEGGPAGVVECVTA